MTIYCLSGSLLLDGLHVLVVVSKYIYELKMPVNGGTKM